MKRVRHRSGYPALPRDLHQHGDVGCLSRQPLDGRMILLRATSPGPEILDRPHDVKFRERTSGILAAADRRNRAALVRD